MESEGARQGREPCLGLSMTGHQFISNGKGNLPLGTLSSVASGENRLGGPFTDKLAVHAQLSEIRGRQEVKLQTEEEGKWGGALCGECGVCILYTLKENMNVQCFLQEGSASVKGWEC